MAALRPGESAEIVAVGGRGGETVRLLELGLTPGVTVAVVKVAPMGDPLEISVRGYHLSLRRAEAARVEVRR